MDFSISEKMQTILGMSREFTDRELLPLEHELREKTFAESIPILLEKQAMVKKMELWAPLHPKEPGMTDDSPLAGWYRGERAGRIYGGADNVHKESTAKRILMQYEGRKVI